MQALEDALNDIANCGSLEEAPLVLDRIASRLGYRGFSYVDVRSGSSLSSLPFFQSTVREDFASTYRSEGFYMHDPVASRAACLNAPFTGSDCPEYHVRSRPGVKPKSRRVMELAFDYGFSQGCVIPVHAVDRHGRPASSFLSLFWPNAPEDMARTAMPSWLRLVALSYHERILELRGLSGSPAEGDLGPMLTDRERDCLLWACRGKTIGETAVILGITERTVKFHLENAMRKLGVHNKFHAIAVAIQLGLILP